MIHRPHRLRRSNRKKRKTRRSNAIPDNRRKNTLKRRHAFLQKKNKKTKTKTKNKTKTKTKMTRGGLKKEDAGKYIGLLNSALKHIYQGKIDDVFMKDDHILWTSGYIEAGIKRGFKLIKRGDTQLDPHCNIVCLSNALILWTIVQLDYHELSDLQKLYLFFLDYLNRSGKNRSAYLPFDYAIKKIDKKIEEAEIYLKKKIDAKAKAKSIKTVQKRINKLNAELDNYKRSYGRYYDHVSPWFHEQSVNDEYWEHEVTGEVVWDDPAITSWRSGVVDPREIVDICDPIDCLFLNETEHSDNPELIKPIEKLCVHLILIFKGIIWLLMKEFSESDIHLYNTQGGGGDGIWCEHEECLDSVDNFATEAELVNHMREVHGDSFIKLDLSIHTLLQNVNCVLIPSHEIFHHASNYDDGLEMGDAWVYTNLKKEGSEYTMDKVKIGDLKDGLYLTANINDDKLRRGEDGDYRNTNDIFKEFIKQGDRGLGVINPVLSRLEINENKLTTGEIEPQLQEIIEESFSQHWYVAPLIEIYDNISIQMAV